MNDSPGRQRSKILRKMLLAVNLAGGTAFHIHGAVSLRVGLRRCRQRHDSNGYVRI
jgi:hypothetical protein